MADESQVDFEEQSQDDDEYEVEYIFEEQKLEELDPAFREFAKVFDAFKVCTISSVKSIISYVGKIRRGSQEG